MTCMCKYICFQMYILIRLRYRWTRYYWWIAKVFDKPDQWTQLEVHAEGSPHRIASLRSSARRDYHVPVRRQAGVLRQGYERSTLYSCSYIQHQALGVPPNTWSQVAS